MSLHIFANIVTPFGTAANNRAETEGNTTTLQKLYWKGDTHSTVSAEAIRFAIRRLLAAADPVGTNRNWDENARANIWKDGTFKSWGKAGEDTYVDDDLLGFMTAEGAKEEGGTGTANVRRAVLEITRAISITPWTGDVTFNAASPGATPSASKSSKGNVPKDKNPVPYATEMHATRYQYGIALTPDRLRDKQRASTAIQAICNLGTVAGNHGRFLFDFSPESVVIRITDDPAPRLLYCFDTDDSGRTIDAKELLRKVKQGDIDATELILGGSFAFTDSGKRLVELGAFVAPQSGVKAAASEAIKRIERRLLAKG